MAIIGCSIECSTSFRGVAQEFGNTFHYQSATGTVSVSQANSFLDSIIPVHRNIHSVNVSYVRARVWTAGGTKEQNEMLVQRQLTGTGASSIAANASMDKERAYLVRMRLGTDTKGRPTYLRKWFHLDVGTVGSQSISTGQLQNTASLSTAQRDGLVGFFNQFVTITADGGPYQLCSPKGELPQTGNVTAHPYLEHHQLGDMWRGN